MSGGGKSAAIEWNCKSPQLQIWRAQLGMNGQ